MGNFGFLIPLIFIGPVIALVINIIIAGFAKKVAVEKGYEDGASAFALTFFFGIIGFIYAAGLPDLVARGYQKKNYQLLTAIASSNGVASNMHEKVTGAANSNEGSTEAPNAEPSVKKRASSVLYNCKSIAITTKTGEGHCTMCGHSGELSYCRITNDIGVKELPICRDCIDALRERAKG